MLSLADTMIDLKLPILLVAPKDKDYSFLDEGDQVMTDRGTEAQVELQSESVEKVPTVLPPKPVKKKKSADAMFMGLGDVIFPGILVISSMTFLSGGNGFGIWSGPTMVALGTLIGGLWVYGAHDSSCSWKTTSRAPFTEWWINPWLSDFSATVHRPQRSRIQHHPLLMRGTVEAKSPLLDVLLCLRCASFEITRR